MASDDGSPTLQDLNWDLGKRILTWGVWQLFGGLLPLWGGALILFAYGQDFHFRDYTENGEFMLYSAALSASALFVLSRELRPPFPFPYRALLGLLVIACLGTSVVLFAAVFVGTKLPGGTPVPNLDTGFLSTISLITYSVTFLSTAYATLTDMRRVEIDPHAGPSRDVIILQRAYREEEGGNGGKG